LVPSFADFFAYLKALLANRTLGFSDLEYPQTVQHFVLAAFPPSFFKFLLILAAALCSLGVFLFYLSTKKEIGSNFSALSSFLRMDSSKIKRQARYAALPRQALIWSFFAPALFIVLLFFEAKFEIPGLGNTIKTAFELKDIPLFYGSSTCAFVFIMAVNMFFFVFKILLRK
jgi:ABC-type dipeptide/oligopeptide/nickel transport system permease component